MLCENLENICRTYKKYMQNLVGKGLHLLGKKAGKGTKIIK